MPWHFFTPEEAAIAGATAAGTFIALLVRRPDWRAFFSGFLVGQLTSFYFVVPGLMLIGWSMIYYRPVGVLFGAFGMILWGAGFNLLQKVSDDPLGTFGTVWRTIRGGGTGGDSDR